MKKPLASFMARAVIAKGKVKLEKLGKKGSFISLGSIIRAIRKNRIENNNRK